MTRPVAWLVALAVAGLVGIPPMVASAPAGEPLVIAIIDTGIRPTHVAFEPGQVVAWYDFSNHASRSNQTTWDPLVATPYDLNGHGTGMASLAAGREGIGLTPGFAPGAKLAIAQVESCVVPEARVRCALDMDDVAHAIRWAVDVANVQVISFSAARLVALPSGANPRDVMLMDALAYAKEKGVLFVTSAGNGEANLALVPDASWMHSPQDSPDVFVVGGTRARPRVCTEVLLAEVCLPRTTPEPLVSQDPMVTSDYEAVVACPASDTCLKTTVGTSNAAPRAASLAIHFLQAARASGRDLGVNELTWLLKQSARPTLPYDPEIEGYGYLDANASVRGDAILQGAPGPSGADWDFRVLYVESIRERHRAAWHDTGMTVGHAV